MENMVLVQDVEPSFFERRALLSEHYNVEHMAGKIARLAHAKDVRQRRYREYASIYAGKLP